jgi:hypothetical protein
MTSVGFGISSPERTTAFVQEPRDRLFGASLLSAKWPDGTAMSEAALAIHGRAVDSGTSRAVVGARVTIPFGTYPTVTRADGAFAMGPLVAARYSVDIADTSLAPFGIVRTTTAQVNADSAGTVTTIPLVPEIKAARSKCGKNAMGPAEGVAAIRVIDSAGHLTAATVILTAPAPAGGDAITKTFHVSVAGTLAVCGALPGMLSANASDGSGRSAHTQWRSSGGEMIDTVSLVLRPPGAGARRRGIP